jgi:hypothetical protein
MGIDGRPRPSDANPTVYYNLRDGYHDPGDAHTCVMKFPIHVEVALAINSELGFASYQCSVLRDALDQAWTREPSTGPRPGTAQVHAAQEPLKLGLRIRPRMAPEGVLTVAVTMPPPTSAGGVCSVAPAATVAATAAPTSATPQ